jgi:hypothetical protein
MVAQTRPIVMIYLLMLLVLLQFNFVYTTALVVLIKVNPCNVQDNEIWSDEGF